MVLSYIIVCIRLDWWIIYGSNYAYFRYTNLAPLEWGLHFRDKTCIVVNCLLENQQSEF